VLHSIQRRLERIYEVEVPHNVDDFLVTDADLVARIEEGTDSRTIDEKLLVVQEDDRLDVALYLDRHLVHRLSDDDPNARLHEGNLVDFLTALEGVSHFLYLTWNAAHQRSISLLELEMQAEVDKYVSAAFLFGQQASGRIPGGLCRWLWYSTALWTGRASSATATPTTMRANTAPASRSVTCDERADRD